MKKNTLLVFLCISAIGFSQNTYVPDDNFEQALIDQGYDSGPLDDYVPTANIINITGLSISNKGISDLTGIEDFTALDNLLCWNNNLTTIDLSQNLALQGLKINGNQLTSLDVSNNTALISLKCYNNLISTLDLSNNPNLDEVRCENNQLTELDVQNGNNGIITNFIASSNSNLNCINVDNKTFSETNWTNIDAHTSFSENCSANLSTSEFNLNTSITLYPNPVKDRLNVSSEKPIDSIIVYNTLGVIVAKTATTNQIELSHLKSGIYLVKIETNNQHIVKKIIVN